MGRLHHAARSADDAAPPTLRDLLALAPTSDQIVDAARARTLGETRAIWPIAVAVLVFGPIATLGRDLFDRANIGLVFDAGALAALLGLAIWGILTLPVAKTRPPHQRIAAIAVLAIGLGVTLSLLLNGAQTLTAAPIRLAAFVSAFGGIIVVAVALHAIRAASIAFAVTLAAMVVVSAGLGLAFLISALLAAIFTAGMLRVASRQLDELATQAAERDADRLASRLVGEFEAHGSGWFWQTDRMGNLTYLTSKVADELKRMGVSPIGERLVNIFRVDSKLAETERTLTFHLSSRTSFSDYSVRPAFDAALDRWWSISGRPILDELGCFQGFIGSGSDLTEKRRAEAEITRLALFDSLTGLANRQRMRLSLEKTLASHRSAPGATSLFLLDLDRFKAVNDTLGHQVGDELLKQVAHRLQRTVGDSGLVGRLGGDEFQVVLPREGDRARLAAMAQDIIAALSEPYFISGTTLSIGCSIGIANAPDHGEDPETLVRNADLALYAAKADGRGIHRFYRPELLAGAQNRKQLEDDLRQALASDEFHLTYQPVVSTADERIVGYEALLRWDHPARGPISPAEFVPVAEECGLIEQIGEWVLRTACAEAAHWPEDVRVAVNVSPIQFANPVLPAIVTSAVAASGIAPHRLELEITEGVFLDESASTDFMFRTLKGIGVRLALDDFGTGYSSLGYLKKAPFDKIKIDQTFVRGAVQPGNRNAAIIKAIVTLAETLGMETTAEGVEQQDEIALIRELGCSHIQGFVYGKPARAGDVAEQLKAAAGRALAIGHRTSRAPRTSILRTARLEIGDEAGNIRIRNISTTGALIDGVDFPAEAVGADVLIELLDNELFAATIRWASDGRAGLQFAEAFDIDRLGQSAPAENRKRTATG
ncbi:EAL domain-containing protein [Sphingomonas sp. MMSM20]|uniref:putative bifunctional diguanylate cyclase/phosphodiesterase n=1 Tax=Sphingomonas lycopersici TaxID=2951807 RepID=UPI0022389501|nr:EAL domain-containing protein [Sphingomonas lycopersici]MCW6531787.1 EAL domain-containing protein [Sphingomonas lycopersici]